MLLVFFFFKQKTAYEMRISDWSSDVCSSDLPTHPAQISFKQEPLGFRRQGISPCLSLLMRSEEHTSELQSLMRISYAVFCLKKKKNIKKINKTKNDKQTICNYTK